MHFLVKNHRNIETLVSPAIREEWKSVFSKKVIKKFNESGDASGFVEDFNKKHGSMLERVGEESERVGAGFRKFGKGIDAVTKENFKLVLDAYKKVVDSQLESLLHISKYHYELITSFHQSVKDYLPPETMKEEIDKTWEKICTNVNSIEESAVYLISRKLFLDNILKLTETERMEQLNNILELETNLPEFFRLDAQHVDDFNRLNIHELDKLLRYLSLTENIIGVETHFLNIPDINIGKLQPGVVGEIAGILSFRRAKIRVRIKKLQKRKGMLSN